MPNLTTERETVPSDPSLRWDVLYDDPTLWTAEEYHEYFTSRRAGSDGTADPRETPETILARLGVPIRYQSETIGQWEPTNGSPPQRVRRWCWEWPPEKAFLTLVGEKGRGKTMLAVGALRFVLERHNVRGLFTVVPDLIDRYRRSQSPDRATETADDIDDLLRRVPLLVLDDLGVGRQTEFAEERLYVVVNRRYNDVKPTIVTTNIDLMALEERIRSRVLSGDIVQFQGEDRRIGGAR